MNDQLHGRKKILVAEDNMVNQVVMNHSLRKLGHEAHFVTDGLQVIEHLKQSEYDLILMDACMPEMDGFEATRVIRSTLNSNIPIVAITALSLVGEKQQCLDAGMNGYLSKPFNISQLQAAIELALQPTTHSNEASLIKG